MTLADKVRLAGVVGAGGGGFPTHVKLAAKASRPPLVAHPVSPKQARPELRVTGIAWEKDSVANAALVNGQPVQQGSMVNGYKVVEILADKVRFSGDKGSLDVPLGGGE